MIITRESREVTVVRLSGRFNMGNKLDRFRRALGDLVAEGQSKLAVELSDVTFVDSATLGEFVASARKCHREGGRLVFAGACGKVKDLLGLTRIDDLIESYDTLATALESFDTEPSTS